MQNEASAFSVNPLILQASPSLSSVSFWEGFGAVAALFLQGASSGGGGPPRLAQIFFLVVMVSTTWVVCVVISLVVARVSDPRPQ